MTIKCYIAILSLFTVFFGGSLYRSWIQWLGSRFGSSGLSMIFVLICWEYREFVLRSSVVQLVRVYFLCRSTLPRFSSLRGLASLPSIASLPSLLQPDLRDVQHVIHELHTLPNLQQPVLGSVDADHCTTLIWKRSLGSIKPANCFLCSVDRSRHDEVGRWCRKKRRKHINNTILQV